MPSKSIGLVALVKVTISVANLIREPNALLIGKSVADADVIIISKVFIVLKVQPKKQQACTGSSLSTRDRQPSMGSSSSSGTVQEEER